MRIMILIIITFLTGLWSCGDPSLPIPPDTTSKKEAFELMWTTKLPGREGGIISTDYTQQYKDWVLVGGDVELPPTIFAFNKKTGNLDWEYVHNGSVNNEIDISVIYDNIYIAICKHGLVAIDLDKRQSIWELDYYPLDYYKENSNTVYNGYLYLNIQIGGAGLYATSAAIIKVNIKTGEHQKIFEVKKQGENLTAFSPPTVWVDNNTNRELLIFNERPNAQEPPQKVIQNIVALDLATNNVVWRTENFTEFFASNGLHPPVTYNDLVITGGDWSIYAFDTKTGKQLWRTEITPNDRFASFGNTNHLIHNDNLYVNETGQNITCLNLNTGEIIWNNPKGGSLCTDNMVYYEKEDYLVYTSWGYGSVMILDALTGKTIREEHKYDNSNYNNDIVYDKELDMFFTSTYKHAVGFKVNAPE